MMNKGLFSSKRWDWRTPISLYQELDKEFHFTCDPCLISNGTIHPADMLGSDWGDICFVNPPYKKLLDWVKKGYLEAQKGKIVVFLIPSRTDTSWWHDYCMKASEIRFIRGRLKFDDKKFCAPFPSCIVVFKNTSKSLFVKSMNNKVVH